MNDQVDQQDGGSQDGVSNTEQDAKDARRMGWADKEQWRGREEDWVDASTFLKRGREIAPIIAENNKRLLAELRASQAEIASLKGTVTEFGELYKNVTTSAYERAITDVKRQIREARKEDNDELVDNLEEQLDSLKTGAKEIKVPQVSAPANNGQQIFGEWKEENNWYDQEKNPKLYHITEGVASQMSGQYPHLRGTRQLLDMITTEVKRVAADEFGNKRRNSSPVDGSSEIGSRVSANGGKHSYNNLPQDAKQQCDRFSKEFVGKGKSYETVDAWRKQYCDNYSWD